jgi:hypothetical protein
MRDDDLKALLRPLREQAPPPGFERCWRDAGQRAVENRSRVDWRWACGPSLAVALGAAVFISLTLSRAREPLPTVQPAQRAGTAGKMAGVNLAGEAAVTLSTADDEQGVVGSLALDWLLDYSNALSENGYRSPGDRDYLTEGSETDFLLTMEIPAWNERGAREVL